MISDLGSANAQSRSPIFRDLLSLVMILAVAALLRLRQLGEQILGDDEWWAVKRAVLDSFSEILVTFRAADNCIPLTIFYKFLLLSVGLNEWGIRGLQLAAGLLMILGFALAVRRMIGREPALIFAMVMATSPLLIFYSRYARPYMLSASLGFGALLAFHAWYRQRHASQFACYVLAAALCGWFSPPTIPAVLAPPVCFLANLLFQRYRVQRIPAGAARLSTEADSCNVASPLALSVLIGVTLLCVIAWLLPTLPSLGVLAEKAGGHGPRALRFWQAVMLFSGTDHTALALAVIGVVGLGACTLLRAKPTFFAVLVVSLVVQVAALLVVRPDGLPQGAVIARYSIVSLPAFLLCLAIGLHRIQTRIAKHWGNGAGWVSVGIMITSLLLLGPLPRTLLPVNSFAQHDDYQDSHALEHVDLSDAAQRHISAFYRELAGLQDSYAVIEFPQVLWWSQTFYHRYQSVHGKRVLVGHPSSAVFLPHRLQHPDLKLSNHIDLENLREVGESTAHFVIIHKDPATELGFLGFLDQHGTAEGFKPGAVKKRYWERMYGIQSRVIAAALIPIYRRTYGPPYFEDRWITVFDISPGTCIEH